MANVVNLNYRQWIFESNRELTLDQYAKIEVGCSETCTCEDCNTFASLKPIFYPEEVKTLFYQLGIDVNKENEFWTILTPKDDGYYLFSGWFLFVGNILQGKDCHVPTSDNSYSVQPLALNSNFKIGFTQHITTSNFDQNISKLVQVEFEIKYCPKQFWDIIE